VSLWLFFLSNLQPQRTQRWHRESGRPRRELN